MAVSLTGFCSSGSGRRIGIVVNIFADKRPGSPVSDFISMARCRRERKRLVGLGSSSPCNSSSRSVPFIRPLPPPPCGDARRP